MSSYLCKCEKKVALHALTMLECLYKQLCSLID